MGLLDGMLGESWDDPRTQAMLALSAGLLSQNGSKGLSAGLLGAGQAYQGARDAESARALKKAQADELMSQIEERKARQAQAQAQAQEAARIQGILPTLMRQPGLTGGEAQPQSIGGVPFFSKPIGAAPMQETPGGLDVRRAIQQGVPLDTIEKLKKLDEIPNDIRPNNFTADSIRRYQMTRNPADLVPRDKMELSSGGQFYNPYVAKPGQTMMDPNRPFSLGNDGQPAPNLAYQAYEMGKAREAAPKVSVNTSDPTALAKAGMDFQNNVRTAFKDHFVIADQYRAMKEAVKNPSAQGDTSLLYSFFKVLDPASTVREGELDLVKSSRSIPDKFKGYAQKLANGQTLTDPERQDLLLQAQRQVQSKIPRVKSDVQAYRENAARLTLDPNLYVPDPYAGIDTPAKTVVKTGNYGGRKVVQYSDGSIEYAN